MIVPALWELFGSADIGAGESVSVSGALALLFVDRAQKSWIARALRGRLGLKMLWLMTVRKRVLRASWLAALGIATVQAGHAAIEQYGGLGLAFETKSSLRRKVRRVRLGFGDGLSAILKFPAFFVNELLLVLVQSVVANHTDHAHMAFNCIADLSNQ